jgi:hypothetical protein
MFYENHLTNYLNYNRRDTIYSRVLLVVELGLYCHVDACQTPTYDATSRYVHSSSYRRQMINGKPEACGA